MIHETWRIRTNEGGPILEIWRTFEGTEPILDETFQPGERWPSLDFLIRDERARTDHAGPGR